MNEITPIFQGIGAIATVLAFVGAVAVLFYRTAQLEKRFEEMSNADRMDHASIGAKVDAISEHLQDFQLTVVSTYVPKDELNRLIGRIEGKIDTLTEAVIKGLAK